MTRAPKRFYKDVAVTPRDGGFVVLLDGKTLKTPAQNALALALPAQGLAEAVAEEWRAQRGTILLTSMPLTRLANTALDRVGKERAGVIAALAALGAHDLLCYRSDNPVLADREAAGWDPLLAWARERYGAVFTISVGIVPVEQQAHAALGAALAGYDDFILAGLAPVIAITGSLVLGLALAEERIDGSGAFALSRIDEVYQAERWGADADAERRADALKTEILHAGRFIALVKSRD